MVYTISENALAKWQSVARAVGAVVISPPFQRWGERAKSPPESRRDGAKSAKNARVLLRGSTVRNQTVHAANGH